MGNPSRLSVAIAGTGLARSSTKSIRPVSFTRSMHQSAQASTSGRCRATAAGEKLGLSRRRYGRNSGGSSSSGTNRIGGGGMEAPWYLLPGSRSWREEKVAASFSTLLTSSYRVSTQKPPYDSDQATGHAPRRELSAPTGSEANSAE
jgi:hypothetical protein